MPVFLLCRGCICAIVYAWQRVARYESKLSRWIHGDAATFSVETAMVAATALIACLFFVSYDAAAQSMRGPRNKKEFYDTLGTAVKTSSNLISLFFCVLFQLLSTQFQFRFKYALTFPVIMACLLGMRVYYFEDGNCIKDTDTEVGLNSNIYFSTISQVAVMGLCVLTCAMSWSMEKDSRQRFNAGESVERTRQRIHNIVSTLMPPMVVEDMKSVVRNQSPTPHTYETATIAQSDLVGFTKLASTRTPHEVVKFIGEIFGKFDELTDKYQVYKVETVGDAYIAGQAERPLTYKNIPVSVVLFGLDMVRTVEYWALEKGWDRSKKDGPRVSCRVGIHHGWCTGGVVGTENQRYHLFGELMSVLEVLESTAPEASVQVSSACKDVVNMQMLREGMRSDVLNFKRRDIEHLTTSKGDIIELEQAGCKPGESTFLVESDSKFRGWIGA
eukprot:TRINITY_DN52122_c0_g1_i1.p1 TRINITY_DN52122_c0_g1~~TRINITY_DN52122_c0_g1_i1.p1  ORF type:complete len:444 (+),score=45.67 TRINITY_DN52122_c0_g1_i1:116-1447(+)